MGVFQILYHHLATGNLLEATELLPKVGDANGMMEDPIGAIVIGVRPTRNADDRQILRVRASNSIHYTEAPNGEGDNAGTDTLGTRVPIRSISSVELIAASNEVEARLSKEVVEQDKVEVPRDSKDVGDPNLHKPPRQVAAKGHGTTTDPGVGVHNGLGVPTMCTILGDIRH
jgi:hypothetical protein